MLVYICIFSQIAFSRLLCSLRRLETPLFVAGAFIQSTADSQHEVTLIHKTAFLIQKGRKIMGKKKGGGLIGTKVGLKTVKGIRQPVTGLQLHRRCQFTEMSNFVCGVHQSSRSQWHYRRRQEMTDVGKRSW